MATGDGLLVRLAPAEGLTPGQLAGLARAAAEFGNGVMEITARGGLQIRGLGPESAPRLAAAAAALGLAPDAGPPVLTGPLAGADPAEIADPRPLAAALRRFDGPLLPKVAVLVDGGGALSMDALAADLRLTATPGGWAVAVGGTAATAAPRGVFDAAGAVAAGLALLGELSRRRIRGRDLAGDAAREALEAREGLAALDAVEALAAPVELPALAAPAALTVPEVPAAAAELDALEAPIVPATLAALEAPAAPATLAALEASTAPAALDAAEAPAAQAELDAAEALAAPVGSRPAIGGFALRRGLVGRGVAAPFGHASAAAFAALAAAAAGAEILRLAPEGALVALGLSPGADAALVVAARDLGFVVDPEDPRRAVVACPGAPACAAGLMPARAMAPALAAALAAGGRMPPGARLHLSGCPKGCARPAGPAVTLVATPEGPRVFGAGVPVPHDLRAWLLAQAETPT